MKFTKALCMGVMMIKKPYVSIIVPCRNEEKFIKNSLENLLSQDYGVENYEVLLIDGISEDKTLEIVSDFQNRYKNLRVFTNEKKVTPFAMNIGAKNSKGDVITLANAHCSYPVDYITKCISIFEKYTDADCVGGGVVNVGENAFAKAVSYAMNSKIGIGNANHRFDNYEGIVEMAGHPFYKKYIFEKIGFFDEKFVKNQDDEFAYRAYKAGFKTYLSQITKSTYYVRSSPKKLFKQYFNYGYYKWIGYLKHKSLISFRHVVPAMFILFILLSLLSAIMLNNFILFVLPIVVYLLIIFFFSLRLIKNGIEIPLLFTLAVVILHVSYGSGYLISLIINRKF